MFIERSFQQRYVVGVVTKDGLFFGRTGCGPRCHSHKVVHREGRALMYEFVAFHSPNLTARNCVEQDVIYQCSLYMYSVANTIARRAGLSLTLSK